MAQKQHKEKLAEAQKFLIGDPAFLREMLRESLQKFLQSEFDSFIKASPYERSPEREGYRNGSYPRTLKTRVGAMELSVCRDREGAFRTEIFERYQRNEQAFVLSMIEMYLKGVSTRKVTSIVEKVCGFQISKSTVSELTKSLDKQVNQWRNRPLADDYPYLVVDARYEKIREEGSVKSKAVLIVIGIHNGGRREILAVEMSRSENEHSWGEVFQNLKRRGLQTVEYIVSDAHKGLQKGITRHFQGAIWQRCQVHFLRNFLSRFPRKEMSYWANRLKEVFQAGSKDEARRRLQLLLDEVTLKGQKLRDWLEEEIEECLSVYALPVSHRRRMRSTNMIERLNEELRRRSRVIRIFPNEASCVRMMGSLCMEYSEEWFSGKRYLDMDLLKEEYQQQRDENGREENIGFPLRSKPIFSEKQKYTTIRT